MLAWTYVAASTLVSIALNVAHAPGTLAAQLIAAIPSVAQLAAIELVMSEARRAATVPDAQQGDVLAGRRANGASQPTSRAQDGEAAWRPHASAREQIRQLLVRAHAWDGTVTGPAAAAAAAAATGVGLRRAQELLKELRAELPAADGPGGDSAQHPSRLARRDPTRRPTEQGGSVAHRR